jgi:class 3 adenylate cyclase
VDSTALASRLDPEEWRAVVRTYQEACAKVIARYDGYIAQYLGDGLLVYFGYPLAHEDDARRAVRAGLGIVEAMGQLNTRLAQECGVQLAVRLGIHTGLVVVGEVGGGTRQEQLALGETPNLAARLQGMAAPNTVVISAATYQLLSGFFACQSIGTPLLKGVAQPIEVYQVRSESTARSRLEAASRTGLTPLVGREQEIAVLRECWAQVKDGFGQVVLLSGEAGIGKSRLVQVLMAQVASEPQAWLTPCQCSPYHQNSALYPMIELLERVALQFDREESSPQKLTKLEGFLVQYGLPLAEAVPLFAALLSLPLAADERQAMCRGRIGPPGRRRGAPPSCLEIGLAPGGDRASLDAALPRGIELHAPTWPRGKAELSAVPPEARQWRPRTHAQPRNEILRPLRLKAHGQLARLEHGAQRPDHDLARVQPLAAAVPLACERHLPGREALSPRWIAAWQPQPVRGPSVPGGTAHLPSDERLVSWTIDVQKWYARVQTSPWTLAFVHTPGRRDCHAVL